MATNNLMPGLDFATEIRQTYKKSGGIEAVKFIRNGFVCAGVDMSLIGAADWLEALTDWKRQKQSLAAKYPTPSPLAWAIGVRVSRWIDEEFAVTPQSGESTHELESVRQRRLIESMK